MVQRSGLRTSSALIAAGALLASVFTFARNETLHIGTQGDVRATSTAATPTAPTTTAPVQHFGTLAVIGDSLSYQAYAEERAAFDAQGWSVVAMDTLPGRHTDVPVGWLYSGLAALYKLRSAGTDAQTWVVELGTNDLSYHGADADAYRKLIEQMLDAIGPNRRVVWVNVHSRPYETATKVFNLVLDAVAKERGNVVVADWAAVASTRGYLAADGVHLSAAGERAYAKVIAAATERVAWLPATVPQRATAAR